MGGELRSLLRSYRSDDIFCDGSKSDDNAKNAHTKRKDIYYIYVSNFGKCYRSRKYEVVDTWQ